MADWPDADELKRVLNLEGANTSEWDTTIARVLQAAIDRVKEDVGVWDDDTDVPTDRQAQAALRMAELIALKPEIAASIEGTSGTAAVAGDPVYRTLLFGSRRSFGIG